MMRRTLNILFMTLVLSIMGSKASHAALMKWCAKWFIRYDDSGNSEDYYTSTISMWVPARYAQSEVINVTASPDDTVWSGFLDVNGCTPYVTHLANTQYHFRYATYLKRNTNREVIATPAGESTLPIWRQEEYTSGDWIYAVDRMDFWTPWSAPQPRVLVVASHMLYWCIS